MGGELTGPACARAGRQGRARAQTPGQRHRVAVSLLIKYGSIRQCSGALAGGALAGGSQHVRPVVVSDDWRGATAEGVQDADGVGVALAEIAPSFAGQADDRDP